MADILDQLVPIIGVIAVFSMPVFIVWLVSYFNTKKEEKFHDTLQELIRSGQELSPEILKGIPGFRATPEARDDIRTGTIATGVGIGIALFGQFGVAETPLVGIGLLVFSIGLAFLAYGTYSRKRKVTEVS